VGDDCERILAHKTIVLARCPAPIITQETMHLQEINVPDFDPVHFRELLRFIYTDRIASVLYIYIYAHTHTHTHTHRELLRFIYTDRIASVCYIYACECVCVCVCVSVSVSVCLCVCGI
jgi:hypothetical protein